MLMPHLYNGHEGVLSWDSWAYVQNLQKLDRGLISKKHRGFFAKFLEY
jgi:hypothetical protein